MMCTTVLGKSKKRVGYKIVQRVTTPKGVTYRSVFFYHHWKTGRNQARTYPGFHCCVDMEQAKKLCAFISCLLSLIYSPSLLFIIKVKLKREISYGEGDSMALPMLRGKPQLCAMEVEWDGNLYSEKGRKVK